jgi:hypothetical protein
MDPKSKTVLLRRKHQRTYVQNFSSIGAIPAEKQHRRTEDITISVEPIFYLSHIEYEGSIGLLSRKMKNEKKCSFSGLFLGNFFRLSRAVAVAEICLDTCSVPMKARKLILTVVFWANLLYLILRILKFRFLRVVTTERFFEDMLLSPKD